MAKLRAQISMSMPQKLYEDWERVAKSFGRGVKMIAFRNLILLYKLASERAPELVREVQELGDEE